MLVPVGARICKTECSNGGYALNAWTGLPEAGFLPSKCGMATGAGSVAAEQREAVFVLDQDPELGGDGMGERRARGDGITIDGREAGAVFREPEQRAIALEDEEGSLGQDEGGVFALP